jgi:integrase
MAVRRGKGKRRKPFKDEWYDRQPNGGYKRRTKWFSTKKAADDHAGLRRRTTPAGRPSMDPGGTVADVVASLLRLIALSRRGNTARSYRTIINTHVLPRFGAWPMRDLSRGVILDFLEEKGTEPVIRRGKTLRPQRARTTLRGILATFSRLGSHAVTCGIYQANPFLRLGNEMGLVIKPKARTKAVKRKAMSRPQLARFLTEARSLAPRWWVLFLFLARTGLRINEALALSVSDVDLVTGTLRVEREKVRDHAGRWTLGPTKSEESERTVNLSAQLTAVLQRWLDVERATEKLKHGWRISPPWLFYADRDPASYDPSDVTAGTLDDSNVRRVMRAILRRLHEGDAKAGVPECDRFPTHFTPHGFRHTFASQLLEEGKTLHYVRKQLGHESIKLTADTYGNGIISLDPRANDCLDDPDWSVSLHEA